MMKILSLVFIQILLCLTYNASAVNWNGNDWAIGCEFVPKDEGNFANFKLPGEQCGGKCFATTGCTHFFWSHGTCYLKKGSISKNNAIDNNDQYTTCGVLKSPGSGNGVIWNGNWATRCEFVPKDEGNFAKFNIPGEQCGGKCAATQGCTHFFWSHGTCYLKKGSIRKTNAISNNDQYTTCGIIIESGNK